MTRIKLSDNGNSPFEKIIGHNQKVLSKWNDLEMVLFQETELDENLLEQIRRTIAFKNECEYCMVKGGKPSISKDERKISIACAFAELFATDHKSITNEHFEILKENFPENQISELCAFISFISASQRLGRIINLTEKYQTNAVTTINELNEKNNY